MKNFSIKLAFFVFIFSLILSTDSFAQIKTWGYNGYGQLGNGDTNDQALPVDIGLTQTTGISGGCYHTLFLQADGTVLSVGDNEYGQLGDGTVINRSVPIQVPGISAATQVAAGCFHSLVLLADGTVKSWGFGFYGQLGDGMNSSRHVPVTVPGLTDVAAIAGGYYISIILKKDGTVWVWGSNEYGQLGNNTTTDSNIPIQVLNLSNIISVSAHSHNLALKADGTVWSWGSNTLGELGNNTSFNQSLVPVQVLISGVSQIAAGQNSSFALKPDGSVWVWGVNYNGQVGNGTTYASQPIPLQNTTIANAIDIRSALRTKFVRLRDGSIYAWSYNFNGEIGNGTTIHSSPFAAPIPTQTLVGTGNSIFSAGAFHGLVANPKITTNAGANQTLQGDSVKMNFSNVTAAGITVYTALDPTSAAVTSLNLPVGYIIKPNEPAYEITTTAAYTGKVQTCIQLNGDFDALVLDQLRLMHAENGALVNRTVSKDLRTRRICASTDSLSSFVVGQALLPVAADVSISGKVTSFSKGLANARVELTGADGNSATVLTNSFGNFSFTHIKPGATYIVSVSSKKYAFAPQIVSVTDNLSRLIFTPVQ